MDHLEKKFACPFSLIYLRFIDDIFFIWTGSKSNVEKFLIELNIKYTSIKFEYEIMKEWSSFLNTEIYIKNNKLKTKIFRKKADFQIFLNLINSEHPKLVKNIVPYCQTLRAKRICSTKKDCDYGSRELEERFLKPGYLQRLADEHVDYRLENVDYKKRSRTTSFKTHSINIET